MIKSIVEITLARVVYDILNSYEFSETTDQSELSENEHSESSNSFGIVSNTTFIINIVC